MNQTVLGTIQGDTIKLAHPLSLADGQQVEIVVRAVEKAAEKRPWGEGIRASAGALADEPEDLETMLAFFRSLRQNDRPPIDP
jgi:hypothetical protein